MANSNIDTKTRILDTAQALIQKVGVNAMSYQDISEAVGIRKASIHYHFPSKEDLIASLLDRYNDYFLRLVAGIVSTPESADMKLRRYCGLFEATLDSSNGDKACLCGMVGAELATLNHPQVEKLTAFYDANRTYLAQILQEGKDAGSFKFAGNVEDMALLIFSLLEGAMLTVRAYKGDCTQQYRRVLDQLMALVKGTNS